MMTVMQLATTACLLAIIVGLISPRLVKAKTRWRVLLVFGGSTFIIAIIATSLTSSTDTQQRNQSKLHEILYGSDQAKTQPSATTDANKFQSILQSKLQGQHPWTLEITQYKPSDITMDIYYNRMPSGYGEVKADTMLVARKALQAAAEVYGKPIDDMFFLYVHAYKRERGETGKELLRNFGRTFYNFNTDQLEWEPAKN